MDIPITNLDSQNENQENQTNETKIPPFEHPTNESQKEEQKYFEKPAKSASGRNALVIIIIIIIAGIYWMTKPKESGSPDKENQTNNNGQEQLLSSDEMSKTEPSTDAKAIDMQESFIPNLADIIYMNKGELAGVGGSGSSGVAGSDVIEGVYHLYAEFENLPDPADGFFYEGWIVRDNPLSLISTGKPMEYNDKQVNAYLSRENLLDHTMYVLTLEPDDGDHSPAEHVLEGQMIKQQ